jgi:hypothetical protein
MQPLPENIQYLFDQHLKGDLSDGELKEFNQRLENEPLFAEQWREFQLLTTGLNQQFKAQKTPEEQDLRRRIAEASSELEAEGFFDKKAPSGKIAQISPVRRYMALAVALAVIVSAIWFFNQPTPPVPPPAPPATEAIFASNFQMERRQLGATLDELEKYSLGEADAENRQALAKALNLVENQQLEQAIPLLKNWLETAAPPTPTSNQKVAIAGYYLAQCLMATGNTGEEPIQLLIAVSNDPAFAFPDDARWYLALCYIKNSRFDLARPLLQTVSVSQSGYAREAEKILLQIH